MRVLSWKTTARSESERGGRGDSFLPAPPGWWAASAARPSPEHGGCDPKDCELRLSRLKPGESPVEGRRGTDAQIVLWT